MDAIRPSHAEFGAKEIAPKATATSLLLHNTTVL